MWDTEAEDGVVVVRGRGAAVKGCKDSVLQEEKDVCRTGSLKPMPLSVSATLVKGAALTFSLPYGESGRRSVDGAWPPS